MGAASVGKGSAWFLFADGERERTFHDEKAAAAAAAAVVVEDEGTLHE